MLTSIRNVKSYKNALEYNVMITAVCVIFLIKLRWPKNKSLYDTGGRIFEEVNKGTVCTLGSEKMRQPKDTALQHEDFL